MFQIHPPAKKLLPQLPKWVCRCVKFSGRRVRLFMIREGQPAEIPICISTIQRGVPRWVSTDDGRTKVGIEGDLVCWFVGGDLVC